MTLTVTRKGFHTYYITTPNGAVIRGFTDRGDAFAALPHYDHVVRACCFCGGPSSYEEPIRFCFYDGTTLHDGSTLPPGDYHDVCAQVRKAYHNDANQRLELLVGRMEDALRQARSARVTAS